MTVKERLKKMLTDCGMFDSQAEEVIKEALPQIEALDPDYIISWDRPSDEYPDIAYSAMWLTLSEVALNWLEKNAPRAWFKPMFEAK